MSEQPTSQHGQDEAEPTARGHRRPLTVVVDAQRPLARALVAGFAPHRVVVVHPSNLAESVDAVATYAAELVVVAPREHEGSGAAASDHAGGGDALHRRVALRAGWWANAVDVVGARLVLVSQPDVFGDPATAPPPDEFTPPMPTSAPGRAWRAAESMVRGAGGSVVRAGSGLADVDVAAGVRWAATAPVGTWHLAGDRGDLDDRHTRMTRGDATGSGDA